MTTAKTIRIEREYSESTAQHSQANVVAALKNVPAGAQLGHYNF